MSHQSLHSFSTHPGGDENNGIPSPIITTPRVVAKRRRGVGDPGRGKCKQGLRSVYSTDSIVCSTSIFTNETTGFCFLDFVLHLRACFVKNKLPRGVPQNYLHFSSVGDFIFHWFPDSVTMRMRLASLRLLLLVVTSELEISCFITENDFDIIFLVGGCSRL